MDTKTTEVIKETSDMAQFDGKTIPLAYHEMCMQRAERKSRHKNICWLLSVVLIVFGFIFLWLQYDYVSTTEYSGVYNLVDSQGNVLTSDISPDDVIRILSTLNDGESQTNP